MVAAAFWVELVEERAKRSLRLLGGDFGAGLCVAGCYGPEEADRGGQRDGEFLRPASVEVGVCGVVEAEPVQRALADGKAEQCGRGDDGLDEPAVLGLDVE